jgi:SPW repeat-containing protein
MSTPRKELLMSTPLIHRPESNGASTPAVTAAAPGLTEYAFPATSRDIGAQASAVLGLLTGVWVALSPWFLTLQNTGTNANTVNLISGLAVAGVGALALLSPRGFAGLQVGSALLGVWLIIAGPILSQKFSIADPMFWSNSVAGGVLIAVAVLGLTAVAMRRPARR